MENRKTGNQRTSNQRTSNQRTGNQRTVNQGVGNQRTDYYRMVEQRTEPSTDSSRQSKGKKPRRHRKRIGRRIKIILQLVTIAVLLSITIGIFYFYHTYGNTILELQADARQKVRESTPDTFKASQTSLVYDSQGKVISTLKASKDVYYIDYNSIPQTFIDAMVVSEDRKFLEHGGVDYIANVRAAIELIKHKGRITQGASTITQQLARGVFLTNAVTYKRKIEEIFLAEALEKKYSKEQIMEYYLNNIYFANGHYGVQAASKSYFGKSVSQLSLSQIAFLCSIPNNPTIYNPVTKFENTMKRRDRILLQLFNEKKISQEDYNKALAEKIKLKPQKTEKNNFVETYVYNCAIRALMAKQGFEFRYDFKDENDRKTYDETYNDLYTSVQKDLYTGGYRIYTSIDIDKQELLQESVDDALKDFTDVNDEDVYELQGAAVSIDNDSGKVVAIVGGRSQDLGGYTLNRAFQSFRQPGSSIKPLIVYTPAFEQGYNPDSTVLDAKIKDGPKNSDGKYLGKIPLHKAVEQSKNTVAWRIFQEVTPKVGLSYLKEMNFSKISDKDNTLAAGLGGLTYGVSPIEMASAYATLENDGYYREPTCIVKIMDAEGHEIIKDTPVTKRIYDTDAARMMTETLTGVLKVGTGKGLGLKNTISAGKTGTTNDRKDGWFVGYTPYYTTSVWVGYDIPKTLSDLQGASYPGRIWHNYMDQIHDSSMKVSFKLYDWRALLTPTPLPTLTPTPVPTPTEDITDNGDTTGTDGDSTDISEPGDSQDPTNGTDPSDGTGDVGDGTDSTGDVSGDQGASNGTTVEAENPPASDQSQQTTGESTGGQNSPPVGGATTTGQ